MHLTLECPRSSTTVAYVSVEKKFIRQTVLKKIQRFNCKARRRFHVPLLKHQAFRPNIATDFDMLG